VYNSQGSERFTDFSSGLARRVSGGFIRHISGWFTRRPSGGLAGLTPNLWKCKPIIIRDADGARHPDRNSDHKRSELKPWLYAVGVNPSFSISRHDLLSNNR